MPVYNAAAYLDDALDSLRAQSLEGFEILAFDDRSTDGSVNILQRFSSQDSRIRVFEREHSGYTPHLNEGIEIARGEFIARMDADDVCMPTRFAQQIAFLEAHPDVVAVGSSAWLIDQWGDPFTVLSPPASHEEIDAAHLRGGGGTMTHPSLMMRTAAVRQIGGYRTDFEPAEDLDLLLRLAEIGRLANVAEPLLQYRVHGAMTSVVRSTKQQAQISRILVDAWERRRLAGRPPEVPVQRPANPGHQTDPNQLRMRKALQNGFPRTAQRYAWRTVRDHPWSLSAWAHLLRAKYARLRSQHSHR